VFDLTPSPWGAVLYLVGWLAGWWLLARPRTLPAAQGDERQSVAVIIPARNEAAVIGSLVLAVMAQCRAGDQIVVVDDASTDDTGDRARAAGATVIRVDSLSPGWAGKPHACHLGVAATTAPVLVFLDADVTPTPTLLHEVAAAVSVDPQALVSVQPWHVTGSAVEQVSAPFNLLTIMGTGAFAGVAVSRVPLAFGPVIALRRERYSAVGGHAHPQVRTAVAEDLALARQVGRTRLFLAGRHGVRYRMYPGGWRPLLEGWTKHLAVGARRAPWWALIAAAAWVTSLAGGWLASPWWYVTSAVQFAILSRAVGSFTWRTAVVYPVLVAVLVAVFLRSLVLTLTRRQVAWKGRRLHAR
jgi:4,4'-diaponeurosporenoate glycosyltransferase